MTLLGVLVLCERARGDVELPLANPRAPIMVRADHGSRWQQGAYEVWHLYGNCEISQDRVRATSSEAVIWIDRAPASSGQMSKILAYLENGVVVDFQYAGELANAEAAGRNQLKDRTWFGRFHTEANIQLRVALTRVDPEVKPAAFHRGTEVREAQRQEAGAAAVEAAQFSAEPIAPPAAQPLPANNGPTARRIRVIPRSGVRSHFRSELSPDGQERIVTVDNGVRVIVEGAAASGLGNLGTLVVETDRVVLWTDASIGMDLGGQMTQQRDAPLEFYLEGNVVFRQGDRVIYAERMYYNVTQQYGMVLSAEVLTPVPDYQGLLRLKAEVLQQLNQQNFLAYGAALTSSRLGVPRYWVQSDVVTFRDEQRPVADPFTGQVAVDPRTGEPAVDHDLLATSRNNFLYIGGVPVFYWPVLATDLTEPTYYIDQAAIKSDSVFGQQLLLDWNLYQVLGIRNPPEGTDWTLSTDYLSERGFGLGTNFDYEGNGLLGFPGPYRGLLDAWGINEQGRDNLGEDRRALLPEEDLRGRILGQHRHRLPNGLQFTGEIGLISDRNFLEQYYENEWDEMKDQTTGLELKQYLENSTWSITADARVNDFFTETEWLPRLDHFVLGQSVLYDELTWYSHSHAGYANLETASRPTDPNDADKFKLLPWEADREGVHAATRQELDWPVELGPVKVVPYVLGELAHWGEDLQAEEVTRAYGQLGVRSSLPMWKIDPTVHSKLLNLNGLAHKVVFESEVFYADANRDLTRFPLYEQLDDNSTEHFRRRFAFDTFGGNIPQRFDSRFFALRSGLQANVTSPSTEIADDLTLARLGVRQRWQTRRGLPGQERIVDWIELDLEGSLFPEPDRDNFGEVLGLVNYDFKWHVGDRLTLLSDGYADLFDDGLRTFSAGTMISRPERGSVYVGYRSLEGPISSNILTGSVSYRMSEKWILTGGTSFDFGPTGNIGQTLAFTRIGESALMQLGLNVDASRDNVGLLLAIEPRFLPTSKLGRVGGVQIPPAGALGLE